MANQMWTDVMKKVHENLIKTNFSRPKNVEEATICKNSGKLANGNCKNTYVEYFRKGTVISEKCDIH